MVDSLCKDGNYWLVPVHDSGKKPSRLWDRWGGQWHIRSDLRWKQHLVMLIKMQTVLLTRLKTSGLFYTCHTVVGVISARPLQRVGEGDVLLTGPDPFQLGQGGQVPFTEALFKMTRCSWRPYKTVTEYKSTNSKTPPNWSQKRLDCPLVAIWIQQRSGLIFIDYLMSIQSLCSALDRTWIKRNSKRVKKRLK